MRSIWQYWWITLLIGKALAGVPAVSADGKIVSLAPMLEQVTPAVVNIAVVTSSPLSQNPLFNDPFFRQFFGDFEGLGGRDPSQSAGSGVIIDAARGIIVTNHHVINRARSIQVTLKNRKTYTAKLIGMDAATDLAVISIPVQAKDDLKAIRLGNSDRVEVGDFAVAIGNPFSIGQTVTSGIVSALGRSGLNIKHFEDFIQTDAAINPGNSGGALVNLQGELIGINTSIIAPAGANVGIGFAIPVNMVKNVAEQIVKNGRVERGAFGVEIADLTDELANTLGIALRDGAVIARVISGTQAEKAGIEAGDVVIELNGINIRSANHLRSQFALVPPGAALKFSLIRAGKTLRIHSEMGNVRDTTRLSAMPPRNSRNTPSQRNNPNERKTPQAIGWSLQENAGKVVITDLEEGGLAALWGLEEGDEIISFAGKEIKKIADLPKEFSAQVDLTVRRGTTVLRIIRR